MRRVRVDMGEPILQSARIPTTLPGDPPIDVALDVGDQSLSVTCVSMGNPHCVCFTEELNDATVHGLGPLIERHARFPKRSNAEFVRMDGPTQVTARVWERGSGETLACGTGACAIAVAGVLTGRTGRLLHVHLPGGELQLEWREANNHVYLTGAAVEVFTGEWPILRSATEEPAPEVVTAG